MFTTTPVTDVKLCNSLEYISTLLKEVIMYLISRVNLVIIHSFKGRNCFERNNSTGATDSNKENANKMFIDS